VLQLQLQFAGAVAVTVTVCRCSCSYSLQVQVQVQVQEETGHTQRTTRVRNLGICQFNRYNIAGNRIVITPFGSKSLQGSRDCRRCMTGGLL